MAMTENGAYPDLLSFDWENDEKPVDVVCQYSNKPTHLTNKNPDVYQS